MLIDGGQDYTSNVADLYDDAKFAAGAMNALGALLDELDEKDRIIEALATELGIKRMLDTVEVDRK